MAKIVFNGKEYPSLEALPPEAREALKHAASVMGDKDKDGIPDALQGSGAPQRIEISHTVVNRSIDLTVKPPGGERGVSLHVNLPDWPWLLAISAAAGAVAVYFMLG
jgi:hypothetical protein